MFKCRSCGKEILTDWKYCPHCGIVIPRFLFEDPSMKVWGIFQARFCDPKGPYTLWQGQWYTETEKRHLTEVFHALTMDFQNNSWFGTTTAEEAKKQSNTILLSTWQPILMDVEGFLGPDEGPKEITLETNE